MATDLTTFLSTKRAGLPTWAWGTLAVAIVSFILLKMKAAKATGTAQSTTDNPAATGTGTWQQSTTDPRGNTTSSSFTGPAYSPGFLSTNATMPPVQQAGDIYVNLPSDVQNGRPSEPDKDHWQRPGNQQQPPMMGIKYPPITAPKAGPGQIGSFWWTTPSEMGVIDIAEKVYSLGPEPGPPSTQQRTLDDLGIMMANPQLDWTKMIPAGTPLFVPMGGSGDPTVTGATPDGASQTAPSSYRPPMQQSSVTMRPENNRRPPKTTQNTGG